MSEPLIHAPYRGQVERPDPLLTLHAPHPFAATVTVTALRLAGYEKTQFEIATSWLGPPLPGTPPSPRPVHASDVLMVDELELAKTIAHRARNTLSRGEIPDLFTLSGQVRRTSK